MIRQCLVSKKQPQGVVMLTGEELGAAIAAAIEKKNVKKKDVADCFGVKPPSIQDWIKRGTIDKAKLPALWQYFSDVVGPEHWGLVAPPTIEYGPSIKGFYPLLTDVQAGAWTELCASFSREDAQGWHPSTKSLGPCGYMLRVKGRSMENPGGSPSFTEGMILHINPDLDPTPGLYVIVRRSGSDEATFKKYIHIDGIPYLEAINPDWPKDQKYLKLMPGDAWCGVVVDASLGGLV